jgi:hypothetical protein
MTFCLYDVLHTYAAPMYAAGNTALIPNSRAMHKASFVSATSNVFSYIFTYLDLIIYSVVFTGDVI